MSATGFQERARPIDVHAPVFRFLHPGVITRKAAQVNNEVTPLNSLPTGFAILQIATHPFHIPPGGPIRRLIRFMAKTADLPMLVAQEIDQVTSDKTAGAGHQDLHAVILFWTALNTPQPGAPSRHS